MGLHLVCFISAWKVEGSRRSSKRYCTIMIHREGTAAPSCWRLNLKHWSYAINPVVNRWIRWLPMNCWLHRCHWKLVTHGLFVQQRLMLLGSIPPMSMLYPQQPGRVTMNWGTSAWRKGQLLAGRPSAIATACDVSTGGHQRWWEIHNPKCVAKDPESKVSYCYARSIVTSHLQTFRARAGDIFYCLCLYNTILSEERYTADNGW